MTTINIIITFSLAILTFHVNHRLKKFHDIKIIINSLFELFGNIQDFNLNNSKEVNVQLSLEILALEKMHDSNKFVAEQIEKLKELRKIYFISSTNDSKLEEVEKQLSDVKFKRLGMTFVILSFFNPRS
jgi:hypothetical protein